MNLSILKKYTSQRIFQILINTFLKILIFVTIGGFCLGIVKTFLELELIFTESLEDALRHLLINVITLLAVLEVLRTMLSYVNEGRVRVTFIVDTVLIVMLNELISSWFKGATLSMVFLLIMIIFTLISVRILAIRFSPGEDI